MGIKPEPTGRPSLAKLSMIRIHELCIKLRHQQVAKRVDRQPPKGKVSGGFLSFLHKKHTPIIHQELPEPEYTGNLRTARNHQSERGKSYRSSRK